MTALRRRHAALLALATAGALAGKTALASSGPGAGSSGRGTFELFEHDTSQQALDLGDAGTSPGDQFVFGGDVSAGRGGPRVGRMAGQCTNSSETEILCSAAFTVDGDQIAFQGIAETGSFFTGQPTEFAITGGTGRYRKASGTLTGRILPNGADAVFTVDLS